MRAIIRFKSFPGHKGIPGHQGGSLPDAAAHNNKKSKKVITVVDDFEATDQKHVHKKVMAASKNHPGKVITFQGVFGHVKIHAWDNVSDIPNAYGEQTYDDFGGFIKDGNIIKPSVKWLKAYNFIPIEN